MGNKKQEKVLRLDDNYFIKNYSGGGVMLIFTETRFKKEDGTPFVFTEKFYFTLVAQALKKYVERELVIDESLELIIEKAEAIYKRIDSLEAVLKTF